MRRLISAVFVVFWCSSAVAATMLCESPGTRYHECRLGSNGRISLVLELSANVCAEGLTWGVHTPGVVWVDRGCRAMFKLDDIAQLTATRVVCESENGGHQVCTADTHLGVALSRQLGRARCVEGISWGYDELGHQVWVDDGCRAEFALGPQRDNARATPVLNDIVRCVAAGGKRTECKADTSEGAQIITQLTAQPCRYNRDWGFTGNSVWVANGCAAEFAVRGERPALQTVVCQSSAGKRETCAADTQFGVAVARELGSTDCQLGRTWGFDQSGIWVSNGCTAEFALGGYRLAATAVPAAAKRVVCESSGGDRNECIMRDVRGVGLIRQISDSACVLNRTWGYGRNGIWVTEGCRAEFAVLQ